MTRFATGSSEDLHSMDTERDSKCGGRTVRRSVALFREFLGEKNANFEQMTKQELAKFLRLFFGSVRKQSGEELKKTSLISIKYGITKYLRENLGIDSENCIEFGPCFKTYEDKLRGLKERGKATDNHKTNISDDDLKTLLNPSNVVFKTNTADGLQKKVWWDIMVHLYRGGPEDFRLMTKKTFAVAIDSSGQEYVYKTKDETVRNNGTKSCTDDTAGEGVMYSRPGDLTCPVYSFKLYLEKLHPDLDALWQRPLESYSEGNRVWYCSIAFGKYTLTRMMSKISQAAGLSKRYTNYCIHATSLQALDRTGFEARQITHNTGLKSESSGNSNCRRPSENTVKLISETSSNTSGTNAPMLENSSGETLATKMPEMPSDINIKPLEEYYDENKRDKNSFIKHQPSSEKNTNVTTSNVTVSETLNDQANILHQTPVRAVKQAGSATERISYSWGITLDLQRSALRWDIKRTMKGLCSKLEEIGEECFVVTVNVNNGWVGHIGTVRGDEYINEKSHILYDFLNYCGESVNVDSDPEQSGDNNSDDEMIVEARSGFEIRLDDDKKVGYNPDSILRDIAKPLDDSEEEDDTVDVIADEPYSEDVPVKLPLNSHTPVVRQLLQMPLSMLRNVGPDDISENVTQLNNASTQGTSKTATSPETSSGVFAGSDHLPGTFRESQILITDVRTQFQENHDHIEMGDNSEVEKSLPAAAAERRLKRKRPNSEISPQTEDGPSGPPSQFRTIPHTRLIAKSTDSDSDLSDNMCESNDTAGRVLRSSRRKKGRKPSLAYLLSRRKSNVNDSEKNHESSEEEEEEESDEEIEQDDPKDEDWHIEKPGHRSSTRRK